MNIYFQEGEFLGGGTDWSSLLIQIIGFGIAIYAAYYGAKSAFNLQIKKEAKEKQAELQDRFNFLNSLAARANKSIVNQVKYLEEFYKEIEEKPSFTHEHKRIALDDVKRLLILLNEEKSFQSYLNKLNSNSESYDDYNKMIYFLDYYNNGLNSIIMNIELTSKEIHEKRAVFSTYFSEYQKKLVLLTNKTEYKNTQEYKQISAFLNTTYSKEEREDIAQACTKFIQPIQNLIAKYSTKDELSNEAFMLGRDCILAYEEIVALNLEYATFFKDRHREFAQHLVTLNSQIEKLKIT
jgi:hypothetical protein